ncbi:MAG: glycosyltransferase [Candidatus Cloacimonetes bacterium]|nr:glycosyltransferase [Candidatus Cloacimonadota bacterium]
MSIDPLITVITVSYNSESTMADNIQSVLNQSYSNIEHLIIDGGSSDKTRDIVVSNNPKARFLSERDNGIYDAMNKGIRLAKGDYIAILNSDDLYFDETIIKKVMDCFIEHSVDVVYGDMQFVDPVDSSKVQSTWRAIPYYSKLFKNSEHPAHPSFFVKKSCYARFGDFKLDFGHTADFEFMMRLLAKEKCTSYVLPEPLVKMRLGGASDGSFKVLLKNIYNSYRAFKVNDQSITPLYFILRVWIKLKKVIVK